jgi:hypothetical protein
MRHVIFIRSDLRGPQLSLTALHELVHARQTERAGGFRFRQPRRLRGASDPKPWLWDRDEAEAWRVSTGIMAQLGDVRSLRAWLAAPDPEDLLVGIEQLIAEGYSGDDLAAELLARGSAVSDEEARVQIMISVTEAWIERDDERIRL